MAGEPAGAYDYLFKVCDRACKYRMKLTALDCFLGGAHR